MKMIEKKAPKEMKTIWHERGLSYDTLEQYLANHNTNIVLVGDIHYQTANYVFQGNLVKTLKPEYFIHEFWEDQNQELGDMEIICGREMARPLLEACLALNVKLKGCDYTTEQHLSLMDQIPDEVRCEYFAKHPNEFAGLELIREPRERKMGKTILEYADKTSRPLIAAVGNCHLLPESYIYQEIEGRNAFLFYGSFIGSKNFHQKMSQGACKVMRTKLLEL